MMLPASLVRASRSRLSKTTVGVAGLVAAALWLSVAVLTPRASFAAQTGGGGPVTMFYRAGDGAAASGTVADGGQYTTLQGSAGFSTGWTHVIPAGNGQLLFYRASDGTAVTRTLGADGLLVNQRTIGGFTPGWTHITDAGNGQLLFYRASDGTAVTGTLIADGQLVNQRTIGGFSPGWTHITYVGGGQLLFYRAGDGTAVTGTLAADGLLVNQRSVGGFGTGWTHITQAGGGRLLFYRGSDGAAATGAISPDGTYTNLQTVGGFMPGWTHISYVGNGKLLFYRASDGAAVTGSVSPNGAYTGLAQVGGFAPGWTHIATTQPIDGGNETYTFQPTASGVDPLEIICHQYITAPTVSGGKVLGEAHTQCDQPVSEMQILVELFANGIPIGTFGHDQDVGASIVHADAEAPCIPGYWLVFAQTLVISPPGFNPPEALIYPGPLTTTHISAADCLPVVVSMSDSDARTKIAQLNLSVGTVTHQMSSAPVDSVISWNLEANGTVVDLVESAGNATIPDVIGDSQATAQQKVIAAGLTVGTVSNMTVWDSSDSGKVMSQFPSAGTPVTLGSSANLTVGRWGGANR